MGRIKICCFGELCLNLILSLHKQIIMKIIKSHKELEVFQLSFKTSMEIFHLSKSFPNDEIYSLTSQIRRSSRSVSANIAEAFRKRRYEKAFVAKLSDSEAEAAETQVWLDYSFECGYIFPHPPLSPSSLTNLLWLFN
jgi:four helix bundle protein